MSINKIKDNYNNRRAFTTRPDRAIEMSGFSPSHTADGSSIQMASSGNSTDFGDLTKPRTLFGGMTASSSTRALFYGGEAPGNSNDIDSMQLASTGNASDHGDLTVAVGYAAATSNGTRALVAGGNSVINTIGFGSIAQTGNFTDFGDLSQSRNALVGICSPVRGVFAGGTDGTSPSPAYQTTIDYITINSTGNATDFGDLSGNSGYMSAANDSSGKAFFIGGATGGNSSKNNEATDVITIASTGNASEFGELTQMTRNSASACQGTSAYTLGGANPSYNNVIQRFVMPSLGNAVDFSDLNASKGDNKGASGAHDGIDWGSVAVQRPSVTYMPGSGRGFTLGGYLAPNKKQEIQLTVIPTKGNSVDFGNLLAAVYGGTSFGSLTRGFYAGEVTEANTIESFEYASLGNSADFGDLSVGRQGPTGVSSTTRGVIAGGEDGGSRVNTIDYVTMSTAGNATDFGDLVLARAYSAGGQSSTRGIIAGGDVHPSAKNEIDYITIASTGDATDFGDLTQGRNLLAGASSGTRAVFGGGNILTSPNYVNTMDYITIASTGNATDFGDLTVARSNLAGFSNSIRGVFTGGTSPQTNVIDFVEISTTGNAADFGDLIANITSVSGCSDSHGGLQA